MGNQRMAGDVWQSYDANSKGSSGFDQSDFDYLRSQNWSNKDIFKAAAKSGSVDSKANQSLSKLGQAMSFKDLPGKAQKDMKGVSGSSYIFMGGDANDAKNYRMTKGATKSGQSIEEYAMDFGNDNRINNWNKESEKRYGGEIFQWGGVNADGSANGLNGYTESYDKNNKKTPFKQNNISWSLPTNIVEGSKQADFDKRYAAKQPAAPAKTESSGGATPKFDIKNFMAAASASTNATAGSGSAGLGSGVPGMDKFKADITPHAYEDFIAGRKSAASDKPAAPYQPRLSATGASAGTTGAGTASSSSSPAPKADWQRFWDPGSSGRTTTTTTTGTGNSYGTGAGSAGGGSSSSSTTTTSSSTGNAGSFRDMADEFRSRYRKPQTGSSIPSF